MKTQKSRKSLVREEWPRIRWEEKKGQFVCDARRTGTTLKQRYFADQSEAETFAEDLAKLYKVEGSEGLTIGTLLRSQAVTAENILKPFGKTIVEAAEFYRDFLQGEQRKKDSAIVSKLAGDWLMEKEKLQRSGQLDPRTVSGIRNAKTVLTTQWGKLRILELAQDRLETFFDGLTVGLRRKENLRSLISQFFNWAISKKHCAENPAKAIKFNIPKTDGVTIFTAAQATKVLRLCETKHTELLAYCAVSLFAGLRPGEAEGLTWENIHLKERTIHILGSTSKTGETHNVHIEDNLAAWLEKCPNKKGPIGPKGKTLERRRQELHAALGYRATIGQNGDRQVMNPQGEEYPQDVLRHSYASHWLAKYQNRAQLAENMCNTVEIIRKHYKKVVSKAEMAAYWAIMPKGGKASAIDRFRRAKQPAQ